MYSIINKTICLSDGLIFIYRNSIFTFTFQFGMNVKLNERTLALLVPRSGSNVLPYGLTLEPLVLIIPHGKTLNRRGQMPYR